MNNTEEFQIVIGEICLVFSTTDWYTTTLMFFLFDKSKTNKYTKVSEQTTLGQKFKMLKEAKPEEVTNQEILATLHGFVDDAIRLADKRNRYIHDLWMFNEQLLQEGRFRRMKMRKLGENTHFVLHWTDHNVQEVRDFRDQLIALQQKLGPLVNAASGKTLIKQES